MCGINGIIGKIKDKENSLKKMNKSIHHRGPDDEGFFIDGKVGLGQVRLSIIDLSDAGHQPMFYDKCLGARSDKYKKENIAKSKYSITYNGEIYNFKDIKKELENLGYVFTTKTDTEIILASYQEWGEDCINKFNGMWAFCIFDKEKNTLFCSRDRMGKKPFYYYKDDKKFIFSSEIIGILDSGLVERKLDLDVLPEFLSFHYTPGKKSLVKNILKLPAGNNIIFNLEKKSFEIKKYWDIKNDEIKYNNFEDAKNYLDNTLNNAVKIRTENSDVPVGTFLSGGLDSSLTSALFKKYYTGKDFHTFNVVWEDCIKNESEFAEIVSKHIGSNHHKFKVTGKDVLENLGKLQKHYSDPISEAGFIPNYFVSKYAKDYVKVVLTGDGADEVFAGYGYYNFLQKFWKLGQIPGVKFISKILGSILPASKYQKGFEFLSNAEIENFDKFFGFTISNFSKKELNNLLTNKFNKKDNFLREIKKTVKNFNSFLNQLQYTDQKVLLENCYNLKPDNALMGNSLEGRAPLQDYRLVEFGFQIPDDFKIYSGKEKYILVEVGKKYLPKEIFERKKQGFGVPIYEWINNELKEIVFEKLNNSILVEKGYLNKKQIDFYLKNINNKYFATRIWTLFSLELFIEIYKLEI